MHFALQQTQNFSVFSTLLLFQLLIDVVLNK